jgi:adenosylcobinamide kinase/adenosylcobinamide-phosphate guanylyltransferase
MNSYNPSTAAAMAALAPLAPTSVAPWQELILGGQKSGKTRRAEQAARDWMDAAPGRQAVYLATGQAWDDEMRARIARHQVERAERVPGMQTVEAPRLLAQALQAHSHPQCLVVVDCLTLWLTNWMMPMEEGGHITSNPAVTQDWCAQRALFLEVLPRCPGPVVVVGNEIGLGVIPLGREVRAFVDALGVLNQDVARACSRATLMAAGLALQLK